MRKKLRIAHVISLSTLLAVPILGGCGSGASTDLSAKEKKDFAGGPRPAGANEAMQKSIEEFRKKHPTGNQNAVPGNPGGSASGK